MLLLRAIAGLALLQLTFAAERTKNVDDGGDDATRINFSGSWNVGQDCAGCHVKPDKGRAFGETWRDTTYYPDRSDPAPTVTVEFEGTGISVFGMLANQIGGADTFASYSFTIDGRGSGSPFVHAPEDTPEYQFNVRFFSVTGLSNGKHTFVLTPHAPNGQGPAILVLFDYVTITYEVPDPVTQITGSTTRITTETTRVTETATRTTSNASRDSATPNDTSRSSSTHGAEDTRTRQLAPSDTATRTASTSSTPEITSDTVDDAQQSGDPSIATAVPIAPIVGGVVGGLAFLGVIAALFLLRRRRQQRMSFAPSVAQYNDFPNSVTQFRDMSPGPGAQRTPMTSHSFGHAGAAAEQTHYLQSDGYWNTFNPSQTTTDQSSRISASTMPLAPLRRQITSLSNTDNSGSGRYSNIAAGMGSGPPSDRTPSEPAVLPSESSATADATLPYLQDRKPAYLYEGSISSRRAYSISNPSPGVSGDGVPPPVPPVPFPPTTDSSEEMELLRQQVGLLQAEVGQLRGRGMENSILPPSYRDAVA